MKQLHFMLHADLGYRTKDIIKAWFIRPSSKMFYGEEEQKQTESVSSAIQETLKASLCSSRSPMEKVRMNYQLITTIKVSMRIPEENGRRCFMSNYIKFL